MVKTAIVAAAVVPEKGIGMSHSRKVNRERLDQAVSERLARLNAMPVDASRLERRLRASLDEAAPPERQRLKLPEWVRVPTWRAASGLAAALLVVASLLTFTIGSQSPAVAAPARMADLHRAMVSGEIPVHALGSLDAARALIAADWEGRDPLAAMPPSMTMSCCLQAVDGRPVVGTLVEQGGRQFTLVIADAGGVQPPAGPQVARGERRYVVHEMNGTGMVMTRAGDKFLCFMGEMPTAELIEMAEQTLNAGR